MKSDIIIKHRPYSNEQYGYIDFEFAGHWQAMNWVIELYANDRVIKRFHITEPQNITIPVATGHLRLKAKMIFFTSSLNMYIEPGKHYPLRLVWDWFWWYFRLRLLT